MNKKFLKESIFSICLATVCCSFFGCSAASTASTEDAEYSDDQIIIEKYTGIPVEDKRTVSVSEDDIDERINQILLGMGISADSGSMTDEMVSELSEEAQTVEEYREEIAEDVESIQAEENLTEMISSVWSAVCDGTTVKKYPSDELSELKNSFFSAYESTAEKTGKTVEEYAQTLDIEGDSAEEKAENQAKDVLKELMITEAIANEAGIEVTESEITAGLTTLAEEYGFSSAVEMQETMGEDLCTSWVLQDKVMDYIYAKADFT